MASLAIDQNILNSYSKPSLDQTKRYLSQARTMCSGLSIPTSFIYRAYLQNLVNNLLNIELDMTSSINKIDEAIYKYNNIEARTYAGSSQLYSQIGNLNFKEMSSSTGATFSKSNTKIEDASKNEEILEFGADFLLTAGTVIATPFTSIWDIGKGIFENDWSFSKTKGMWGASVSLVKEEDTFKRVGATIANSFIALTKGLAHLGEALLKFADIVNTAMDTIKTGWADIKNGISTGDWDWKVTKDLWKKTKARVSRQYVNEAYDWFYNTKIGKALDKYAYEPFKSDGIACQILDGVGYAAGIIIVTALTFGSTAPLFLAMTATSAGIGKYTSEEWNKNTVSLNYNGSDFDMQIDYKKYSEIVNLKNGESTIISQIFQLEDGTTQEIKFKIIKKEDGTYEVFDMQGNKVEINGLKESSTLKGLGIGTLKGGWEGLQYYVGGKIGTGNFKCLTNLVNNPMSKVLLRSGIRVTLDTATGAVEVPFETLVTKLSDDVSWKEAWDKSGGWQEVKNQAIIAGGMSFIGEGSNIIDGFKTKKLVKDINLNGVDEKTLKKISKLKGDSLIDFIDFNNHSGTLTDNIKLLNRNQLLELVDVLDDRNVKRIIASMDSNQYVDMLNNAKGALKEKIVNNTVEIDSKSSKFSKARKNIDVNNIDNKIAIADYNISKGREATIEIDNTSQLTMQQLVNIKNSDSDMFLFNGQRLSANDIMEVKSFDYIHTKLEYNQKYNDYLNMLNNSSEDLKNILKIADEGKTVSIPASEINNYNSIRAAQFELDQIKTKIDISKTKFDLPTRIAYIDNFLKNSDDMAHEVVIKKLMELSGSNTDVCDQFADNLMILKNKYEDFRIEIDPDSTAYWSKGEQKIVLDDNFSQTTLFHELGHSLFDTGYDGIAPSNFDSIKTAAAERLRHNDGGSLDSFKRYIIDSNETYDQILKKQTELFDKDMASKIYSSITSMYDDDINSVGQILKECGFDDNQVLDLLNGNSRKETIDMVYDQYRQKIIRSNTSIEFESTGDSAVHDIISSVYDGGTVYTKVNDKKYSTIFGHDRNYYKGYYDFNGNFINYTLEESNSYKIHEQIANFTSLKLQNKNDKLRVLRDMFGDDWYNMMDSIYKNIIGG